MAHQWQGIINEYRERLPFDDADAVVTLKEGGTPLVRAEKLAARTGAEVYIKVEGANPTGSFKDRGMTSAITQVVKEGTQIVACASTGNTSASAAAYAAKAGLGCAVILPAGKIAAGKLAQAIVHGANLVAVDGNFDDCLRIVRELTEKYPVALVNSVNPYRLQGQKTAAFEIVDELGDAPDIHILPVGNAGNISAYWMGYNEYAGHNPETVATAIRIGNPASWNYAVAARDDSRGWIRAVSDEDILRAQRILAEEVGIFVEPASAASVAGLLAAAESGEVPENARIVCTVTGNGLKDTATALAGRDIDFDPIASSLDAAVAALGL